MLVVGCCGRLIRKPLAVQQQADKPVVVNFTNLKPVLASVWVPNIAASTQSLQVPVTGLPGTPLSQSDMSRLTYTVTFERKAAYILRGTLNISPHPMFASNGQTAPDTPIQQPMISLSQSSQLEKVPENKVKCTSLMVTDASSVTCTFSANIFADTLPPAGTAQATITIPGSGAHVQTPAMPYDFTLVLPPNARFSSTDQSTQFLLNSMETLPPTAVVTNYFEKGDNLVLPTGVSGTQPAADSILKDTHTFTYTALFADLPREMCGKQLQVS